VKAAVRLSPEVAELFSEDSRRLYGHCRKSSPQETALRTIHEVSRSGERVTVELARKPGASRRQFEITRVLAKDWVVSGKASDEKFK